MSHILVIIAILAAATALRLSGIHFGLPYTYHPDEPGTVNVAVWFFTTGDLNPRSFLYPTLYMYIVAVVYLGCYLLGLWQGKFAYPSEMPLPGYLMIGVGRSEVPEQFLLARLTTATLGVLTVGVAYYIAKRLWGHRSGWIAALWVAVSSLHVANSQFATVDVPMTLMVILSLAFCVRLMATGHWRDYLLAGLFAGFAIATKYNALPIIVSLVIAHSLRSYPRLVDWRLAVGLGATVLAFLVGTPYAFVEFDTFRADVLFQLRYYATGHPGAEGPDTWWWILRNLLQREGSLLPMGILGVAATILTPGDRRTLPLSAFILTYYMLMGHQVVRFERNLVPFIPALAVLAAGFVEATIQQAHSQKFANFVYAGLAGLIVGGLIIPLAQVVQRNSLLSQKDVRTVATEWIVTHIPTGSHIAGEPYAPTLDPKMYRVEYFGSAIEHEAEWYMVQGFDYLMLSSGMYKRFYVQTARYAHQVVQYESLFHAFPRVATFAGPMMGYPGSEIIILGIQR